MKELRERIAKILDEHISAGICWDETQLDGGPKASVRGERITTAAAPTVLWRGKGRWIPEPGMPHRVNLIMQGINEMPDGRVLGIGWGGSPDGRTDGQLVTVLVLADG